MRSRITEACLRVAAVAAVAAMLSACALTDGAPWGTLELAIEVSAALPPERVDPAGRIRTAGDYRIADVRVSGVVAGVVVQLQDPGGTPSFDPGAPPPGYSLCHAGHCHADDGSLVAYDEIEAALQGGAAEGARVDIPYEAAFELASGASLALPGACPLPDGAPCDVDRGATDALVLEVRGLRVMGTAFDGRSGDSARIAEGGVPFEHAVQAAVQIRAPLTIRFERGEPVTRSVRLEAAFAPSAFDAVDWSADPAAVAAALDEAVRTSLGLEAHLLP